MPNWHTIHFVPQHRRPTQGWLRRLWTSSVCWWGTSGAGSALKTFREPSGCCSGPWSTGDVLFSLYSCWMQLWAGFSRLSDVALVMSMTRNDRVSSVLSLSLVHKTLYTVLYIKTVRVLLHVVLTVQTKWTTEVTFKCRHVSVPAPVCNTQQKKRRRAWQSGLHVVF